MSDVYKSSHAAIVSDAAKWVIRLDEGGLSIGARRELLTWLQAAPRHVEEFLLATSMWRELDDVDSAQRIDVENLVREAHQNVVELRGRLQLRNDDNKTPNWQRRIAAIAAMLAVSASLTFLALQDHEPNYVTGVGQQMSFTLSDGSIIHLNTRSALDVAITQEKREITLLSGEAMFVVAKDPSRPFRVRSGSAVVEAIGTQFNVYRRPAGTTVTVVEGRVAVAAAVPSPQTPQTTGSAVVEGPLVLSAGEEAQVNKAGDVTQIEGTDLEKNVAWRDRRLVFRGDALANVASEFNRYNRQQISIQIPESSARKITGTFDADDPDSFIEFLSRDPTIDVTREGNRIVIKPNPR